MRVTFLGTGAAGGVPLYGCRCLACELAHVEPGYTRLPCSVLVESGDDRVLIDAGRMDLHNLFPPGALSAIVLTHYHPDHVQGLFHLRWGKGAPLPVFGPPDAEGCADLYKHPGLLQFQSLSKFSPFNIGTLSFTPLPLIHSKVTLGYAIESGSGARFAYLTDTVGLPPRTSAFLKDWKADGLAMDCTHPPRETVRNHNDWRTALEVIREIAPARSWLTHISHEFDAWQLKSETPPPANVEIACDGQVIELTQKGHHD